MVLFPGQSLVLNSPMWLSESYNTSSDLLLSAQVHKQTSVQKALETAKASETLIRHKEKHCDQLPWRSQSLKHLDVEVFTRKQTAYEWVCARHTGLFDVGLWGLS